MKTHFTQPATPGNNAYFNFYRLKRQSARAITTGLLTVAATCCAFAQTPKFIVSAGSYAPATATTSIQNIGPGYGGWYSLPPAVSTPQLTLAFSGLGSVISNDTDGFDSDNTLVTACGLPGSSGANKIVFPGNIAEGTEANPTNSFKISFTNLRFTSSSNPELTFNFNQLT